jgi:choline dehydrogenase
MARRLAENPAVSVLLLEAGGHDDLPSITDGLQWASNLKNRAGLEFRNPPEPPSERALRFARCGQGAGRRIQHQRNGLGAGHKSGWDYFAHEAGDPAWSYESVLKIYGRIEDWHGAPDPKYRGTGGRFLSNPRLTRVQLLWPCWKERARSGSQPLKIRMVA